MTEGVTLLAEGSSQLGIELDDHQAGLFESYAELLLSWNQRYNLIGPSAVSELWSRHFLDALTVVLALPPDAADYECRCLDVGSGAGIPGIPLAIAFPRWTVTLLEVTTKKVRFLEMAREQLGLGNTRIVRGRAEDVAHDPEHRAAYDLCVARAVAHTAALLELTLPFVCHQGEVVLYKGLASLSEELEEAEGPRQILGGSLPTVTPVVSAAGRCLVRYRKVCETPSALPRRVGVPEHQPLVAPARENASARPSASSARRRR